MGNGIIVDYSGNMMCLVFHCSTDTPCLFLHECYPFPSLPISTHGLSRSQRCGRSSSETSCPQDLKGIVERLRGWEWKDRRGPNYVPETSLPEPEGSFVPTSFFVLVL